MMTNHKKSVAEPEIKTTEIPEIMMLNNEQSRKLLTIKQPHRFNGIFVAFIKGGVSFKVDGYKTHESSSVFLLLWTYSYLEILDLAEDAEIRIIMIPSDVILEKQFFDDVNYIFTMYKYPYRIVNEETMDKLLSFGRFMQEEQNIKNKEEQYELNKQLSYALFLRLMSVYMEENLLAIPDFESDEHTVPEKFHILLFQYMWSETAPAFYAEKLGLTSPELSSIIEKEWGDTTENWIALVRINQIIITLRTSSVSLDDIVVKFCFSSLSELKSYFVRHTGKPISAYMI